MKTIEEIREAFLLIHRNATLNYPRAEVGSWCKRADAALAKAGRR